MNPGKSLALADKDDYTLTEIDALCDSRSPRRMGPLLVCPPGRHRRVRLARCRSPHLQCVRPPFSLSLGSPASICGSKKRECSLSSRFSNGQVRPRRVPPQIGHGPSRGGLHCRLRYFGLRTRTPDCDSTTSRTGRAQKGLGSIAVRRFPLEPPRNVHDSNSPIGRSNGSQHEKGSIF